MLGLHKLVRALTSIGCTRLLRLVFENRFVKGGTREPSNMFEVSGNMDKLYLSMRAYEIKPLFLLHGVGWYMSMSTTLDMIFSVRI